MRGRFAPSPTGEMHLGNAWTALLAWLQVRAENGFMVLRMEDLDPDRSRPQYAEGVIADLRWLGLEWDEGPDVGGLYFPYNQNERRELYERALDTLNERGLVYPCYCTRAELAASAPHAADGERVYPGTCRARSGPVAGRKPSLRLLVPTDEMSFVDGVRGSVTQNIQQAVGDFVIRRSDGVHAYQLAVVVDDAAMGITHVLRGDDLLDSTPRQLLLYHLLGLSAPAFAHVPLLMGEDGHRLSKRHGDLSIAELRNRGIKPERIIGFLAWKARLIDSWEPVKANELINNFKLMLLPSTPVIVETCISWEL